MFNSSDSLYDRRLFLPKLRNVGISVYNFQSMKSPVELNSLFLNFFVISTYLFGRDTGRLANEAFTSNPIVYSNQKLSASGLKITNWDGVTDSPFGLGTCVLHENEG